MQDGAGTRRNSLPPLEAQLNGPNMAGHDRDHGEHDFPRAEFEFKSRPDCHHAFDEIQQEK